MPSSDFSLMLPPQYPPLKHSQNNLHLQIQIPNACPGMLLGTQTVFSLQLFFLYIRTLVTSTPQVATLILGPLPSWLDRYSGSVIN